MTKLIQLKTFLLSGAGNTFHIFTNEDFEKLDGVKQADLVRTICNTHNADGAIQLNQAQNNLFRWDFFNNDGSPAEMCGNATRCVGYYVKNILRSSLNSFNLITTAGQVKVSMLLNNLFQIEMTEFKKFENRNYFFCDTGVPHIVIQIYDFDHYRNYLESCQKLRFDPQFGEKGTNVTLVQMTKNPNRIQAVTYERGVEEFTQACGTGAAAAAFFNYQNSFELKTLVEMPGGSIMIDLTDVARPLMIGSAKQIGDYNYEFKV